MLGGDLDRLIKAVAVEDVEATDVLLAVSSPSSPLPNRRTPRASTSSAHGPMWSRIVAAISGVETPSVQINIR
jgi:hypothetical protein